MSTLQNSAAIDIIDLDLEDSYLPFDLERNKEVQMAFTVSYIKGGISNYELILLKGFLGLLPPLATPKYSIELSLCIATIRMGKDGLGGLVGALMIMDEIARIFTLEDQGLILNKLRGKQNEQHRS